MSSITSINLSLLLHRFAVSSVNITQFMIGFYQPFEPLRQCVLCAYVQPENRLYYRIMTGRPLLFEETLASAGRGDRDGASGLRRDSGFLRSLT